MTDGWAIASAIGSCLSAFAAAAALAFLADQTGANARAVGFASAQAFSTECRVLWKECRESENLDKFSDALGEILASFELFSIAVSDLNLSNNVRDHIVETITDYLSDMLSNGYSKYVSTILSKPHVCKQLKRLAIQYRSRFSDREGIADMLKIDRASLV